MVLYFSDGKKWFNMNYSLHFLLDQFEKLAGNFSLRVLQKLEMLFKCLGPKVYKVWLKS